MTGAQAALLAIFVVALVAQAVMPSARLLIVTLAAAITGLTATVLGVATMPTLMADVPWGVIVILVALGLLAEMVAASRLFGVLTAATARFTRVHPPFVLIALGVGMYGISGLMNNLTALILMLPPTLTLLQLMGADRRYIGWALGTLLVACNLGGAATPIGDFPAILLFGRGVIGFGDYLIHALPATAMALAALLAVVVLLVRPWRAMPAEPAGDRLTATVMTAIYRGTRVDWRLLSPVAVVLAVMLVAWATVPAGTGIGADLICWLGVIAALISRARLGERLLRSRVDLDAALFLLSLFVMVGAVRQSGLFELVSQALIELPLPALGKLIVFMLVSGLLTAAFSAGPSMAALLEVAPVLAEELPHAAVYVGLAMSVCAGSSFFLTAATSGPLAQSLVDRAGIKTVSGEPVVFGFREFLPVGLMAFVIIQLAAVLAVLEIAFVTAPLGVR